MFAYIIPAVTLCATAPLCLLRQKLSEKTILTILKTLSLALFTLAILRGFLSDNFIWVINGGEYGGNYYTGSDISQSLLRWFLLFGYVVFPCAAFFSSRVMRNFAVYFCTPAAIVSVFFYNEFMEYFLTDSGRAIFTDAWIRHTMFSAELILAITLGLLFRFCLGHRFAVKDKTEWFRFLGLLPLALIITVPVVLPQSLFGFTGMFMVPLSFQHFAWLGVILFLFLTLYFAFRFQSRETRRLLCFFLALFLALHYNSIYLMDLKMSRLPFQLCNLGSYLIVLALLMPKRKGFFNFVFLANVPGSLIALFAPDTSEGMLSFWNIHFYIEHTWVFILPLLIVALRIFERPTKTAVKHYFIGFTIYYFFCAASGIIANCFLYEKGHIFFNEVNYFYLFNNTVLQILPFLRFTYRFGVTWGGYTFYPLYMLSIYVLFSVFCMAFFYVFRKACEIADDHFKLRQIRISLFESNGRYAKRKHIPQKFYLD